VSRRRAGWLTLGLGLALLVLVGRRAVGQPPLYDGLVIEDPYRYLTPAPGAPGNPSSVSDRLALEGGVAPSVYSGTLEIPPQAQVIVDRDTLALAAGTNELEVSIQPIPPPAPPGNALAGQHLAGNVYRIRITDQAGTDLRLKPGTTATVVIRAPAAVTSGTIAQYTGNAWVSLATISGGLPDMFSANPREFGTFAVITSAAQGSLGASPLPVPSEPAVPGSSGGISTPIWIAIGLLGGALVLGIWYLRDVSRQGPPAR
jgi:hypothetical protein